MVEAQMLLHNQGCIVSDCEVVRGNAVAGRRAFCFSAFSLFGKSLLVHLDVCFTARCKCRGLGLFAEMITLIDVTTFEVTYLAVRWIPPKHTQPWQGQNRLVLAVLVRSIDMLVNATSSDAKMPCLRVTGEVGLQVRRRLTSSCSSTTHGAVVEACEIRSSHKYAFPSSAPRSNTKESTLNCVVHMTMSSNDGYVFTRDYLDNNRYAGWVVERHNLFSAVGFDHVDVHSVDCLLHWAYIFYEGGLHESISRRNKSEKMQHELARLLPQAVEETRDGAWVSCSRLTVMGKRPAQ